MSVPRPKIPPGRRYRRQRDERDAAIRKAFDGENYARLADLWDLSERQIRRIIDDPRSRDRQSRPKMT